MTESNKLQTLKIVCPHCGDKQLRTTQWVVEQQVIECRCGHSIQSCDFEQLINQAVNDLK